MADKRSSKRREAEQDADREPMPGEEGYTPAEPEQTPLGTYAELLPDEVTEQQADEDVKEEQPGKG